MEVLGNPGSTGSYAASQDLAPPALRAAGLLLALHATDRRIIDLGDLPTQSGNPTARTLARRTPAVVDNLRQLNRRLTAAVQEGNAVLVVGGNCLIALAAVGACVTSPAGQRHCRTFIASLT